mgnify:CR=1 FL=1
MDLALQPVNIHALKVPGIRVGEILLHTAVRLFTLVPLVALLLILFKIYQSGMGVISWEFLTEAPSHGMLKGGIFPCIFGTLMVTLLMILLALPLGICAAVYLVEYGGNSPLIGFVKAAVNNLAGVPSIVFGLFGVGFFILFVGRGIDKVLQTGLLFGQPCMLWAAATLSVLVLPVIIVSTEEALNAVPQSHRTASLALGATKWQTIWHVVLPQARGGILTGAILAVSRGAGETAPILFTGCAFFLPHLPVTNLFGVIPMVNPFEQFMELSYHIFVMATQSVDAEKTLPIQYGTTLVLLAMTFLLNLTAIVFRIRHRKMIGRLS